MTKSELKSGMIVTCRNKIETVVYLNSIYDGRERNVLLNEKLTYWLDLNEYREDLTHPASNQYDIVKVEIPWHPYAFQNLSYEKEKRQLVWKREEIKEMTIAEIEKLVGCKVKIVKGENDD